MNKENTAPEATAKNAELEEMAKTLSAIQEQNPKTAYLILGYIQGLRAAPLVFPKAS